MPPKMKWVLATTGLVLMGCQSSRNNILHHGSAKVGDLTPTRGSVVVQTPAMLPQGLARTQDPQYGRPLTPTTPLTSVAANTQRPPVQVVQTAANNPLSYSPPLATASAPASNVSAAVPTEFTKAPAGSDPFTTGKPAPSPATPVDPKYQPNYPQAEPFAPPASNVSATNPESFQAPVAAPSRSATAQPLPLPVSQPTSAGTSGNRSQAATGGQLQPPAAPSRSSSSSLFEEFSPPK